MVTTYMSRLNIAALPIDYYSKETVISYRNYTVRETDYTRPTQTKTTCYYLITANLKARKDIA